jgi:hypothetical protein
VSASWADGDRAMDRRRRTAGHRGLRCPSQPAAALRARRGCGQPGLRAVVGGLVAPSRRLRRRTVDSRGPGPVDQRPRAAELEDVGRAGTGRPRWDGVVRRRSGSHDQAAGPAALSLGA